MTASIAIPTYTHPDYLEEAVESVRSQTVKPKEIIIRGGSEKLQKKLNAMIREVTADAFVILADDDLIDPEYLKKTMDVMEQTNADIVYTGAELFGHRTGVHQGEDWDGTDFSKHVVAYFTSLIKKSAWEKVGGFDEKLDLYEDWDFFWSCKDAGLKGVKLPEPLFKHRTYDPDVKAKTLLSKGLIARTFKEGQKSRKYIMEKHHAKYFEA